MAGRLYTVLFEGEVHVWTLDEIESECDPPADVLVSIRALGPGEAPWEGMIGEEPFAVTPMQRTRFFVEVDVDGEPQYATLALHAALDTGALQEAIDAYDGIDTSTIVKVSSATITKTMEAYDNACPCCGDNEDACPCYFETLFSDAGNLGTRPGTVVEDRTCKTHGKGPFHRVAPKEA